MGCQLWVPPEPGQMPTPDSLPGAIFLPPGGWAPHHAHDVLIVCSSETADAIAALFGRAVLERVSGWDGIHPQLHDHLAALGKEIRSVPVPLALRLRELFDTAASCYLLKGTIGHDAPMRNFHGTVKQSFPCRMLVFYHHKGSPSLFYQCRNGANHIACAGRVKIGSGLIKQHHTGTHSDYPR